MLTPAPTQTIQTRQPIPKMSVVVLTGASSGIGHATALAFAQAGSNLVLAARGRSGLDAVAQACRRLGVQVLVVPTDVTDSAAVQALADAAIEHFGGFDVWVNNVGVGVVGLFHEVPLAAHRRVIETNLLGYMSGAHVALAHFTQRSCGTLINVLSIAGLVSSPYSAAYVASKFGLRGFSESVRAEMSGLPGVQICDVFPTMVDTLAFAHAANYTGRHLKPPPPVVDARTVAAAVVSMAEQPRPWRMVGSVALPARLAHAVAPTWLGRITKALIDMALARADRTPITNGNLYSPSLDTRIDGGHRQSTARLVLGAALVTALGCVVWRMGQDNRNTSPRGT